MSCNICSRTPTKRTATVRQIISFLEELGIPAERKSSYDDVEALKKFGLDIIQVRGGNFYGCYVGSRAFELPELKLLAGSVQSSKFITHKKPLGLSALPESDRVAAKTEPYPGRWTTHFVISGPSDLDEELFDRVAQAYQFAQEK